MVYLIIPRSALIDLDSVKLMGSSGIEIRRQEPPNRNCKATSRAFLLLVLLWPWEEL